MTEEEPEVVATMRRAITAVRREGYKAAFIYAVLDGTLIGLVADLLLTVFRLDILPNPYPAITVGFLGGLATFAYRIRKPLIERFEAVNPEVHEALRTARDAIEDDDTSTMARALYTDVIDRLQNTSSVGLLSLPRIGLRFVFLFALSLGVIQASMLGVVLDTGPIGPVSDGNDAGNPTAPAATPTPAGLQSGDEVLGDPTTVTPGGENLSAAIRRQAGQGDDEQQREYETGGLGDDGSIEAERAGYAPPDDIENAELIKEYNLRIREETDDGS